MNFLKNKTAVVLFNLGGPDSLKAVKPFLFNLFNDKAIIGLPQPFRFLLAKLISSRRNKKAQKIYEQIGGKSPLVEITNNQAFELEKELSYFGDYKVFVAMRYWKPFSSEVIKEVIEYNPNKLILLPLYPQFSSSTSKSSLEDFAAKITLKKNQLSQDLKIKVVCCYPQEENFIRSHALLIKQKLMKLYDGNLQKFRFLFSAHGLPQKLIDAGDPYVFHVEMTTNKVVKNLAEIFGIKENEIAQKFDFQTCYQSKVGPLQWTSPSLDHEINRAALDKKIPVIIPISFVSDHSETLVELDIDYKNKAKELGINEYLRVASLNVEGNFIKSLANICKSASEDKEEEGKEPIFSGIKKLRICPNKFKFCPNSNRCES